MLFEFFLNYFTKFAEFNDNFLSKPKRIVVLKPTTSWKMYYIYWILKTQRQVSYQKYFFSTLCIHLNFLWKSEKNDTKTVRQGFLSYLQKPKWNSNKIGSHWLLMTKKSWKLIKKSKVMIRIKAILITYQNNLKWMSMCWKSIHLCCVTSKTKMHKFQVVILQSNRSTQ